MSGVLGLEPAANGLGTGQSRHVPVMRNSSVPQGISHLDNPAKTEQIGSFLNHSR